jgi:hypothetical protein
MALNKEVGSNGIKRQGVQVNKLIKYEKAQTHVCTMLPQVFLQYKRPEVNVTIL